MIEHSPKSFIVVGGGLAGVTTAYRLGELGYDVTLLEANPGLGEGAGFANGAMLTPSMAEPWNAPGVMGTLLRSFFDPTSPMKLRLKALPSLVGWGVSFLRNSSQQRYLRNVANLYKLARYSVEQYSRLRDSFGSDYDAQNAGTLKVFRDIKGFETSKVLAEHHRRLGMRYEVLDVEQTLVLEPQLNPLRRQIIGALYFPDDEVGDAHKFCRRLGEEIINFGGEIRTGVAVEQVLLHNNRVSGVQIAGEQITADAVVLCLGSDSRGLARASGIRLPIRPVKGYSITFDTSGLNRVPGVPVIDDALHAAVVPLGDRLRVVGTAEFTGHDQRLTRSRLDNLKSLLEQVYPELAPTLIERDGLQWAGFRPMSNDGLPFIGESNLDGLWINMGHGHLGWTLSVGSAHLLGDLIAQQKPAIDPQPYLASR